MRRRDGRGQDAPRAQVKTLGGGPAAVDRHGRARAHRRRLADRLAGDAVGARTRRPSARTFRLEGLPGLQVSGRVGPREDDGQDGGPGAARAAADRPTAAARRRCRISGGTAVVYSGDASADRVQLQRYVDTAATTSPITSSPTTAGITPQSPCVRVSSTMAGCRITAGRGYQLNTGDGNDAVTIQSGAPGGGINLGAGQRHLHRPVRPATSSTAATATTCSGRRRQRPAWPATAATTRWPARPATTRRRRRGRRPARVRRRRDARGRRRRRRRHPRRPGLDRLSYLDHSAGVIVTLDDRARRRHRAARRQRPQRHRDARRLDVRRRAHRQRRPAVAVRQRGHRPRRRPRRRRRRQRRHRRRRALRRRGRRPRRGLGRRDYLEGGAGEDIFEGDNVCDRPSPAPATPTSSRPATARPTPSTAASAPTPRSSTRSTSSPRTPSTAASASTARPPRPSRRRPRAACSASSPPGRRAQAVGARRAQAQPAARAASSSIKVTCPGSCRVRARLISGRTVVASRSRTRLGAAA